MVFGIVMAFLAVAGIVYGIGRKNRPLAVFSGAVLTIIAAIGIYFYYNPY